MMNGPGPRVAFGGLLLALASACAHPKEQTSVPLPLVRALAGESESRPETKYFVGTVPDGFPVWLRPAGTTRAVGGVSQSYQSIAVFADSSRPIVPVFEALFERAGLRRPPARAGSGFMSGTPGGSNNFCGDSGSVYINPVGRDPNMLRVTFQPARPMYDCRSELRDVGPDLMIPELRPPAGVHVPSAGGGRGSDGVNARAQMTGTNLVPGDILTHYANQLIAAGWKGDAPAISARVAVQFFEARSAGGQTWVGTLLIVGSGSSLSLTLNMRPQ